MPHLDMRYVTREGLDIFSFMEQGFLTGDNRHSPNRYVTHAMFAEIAGAGARIVMDGHGGDYTVNPRGQNALARMLWKRELRRFVSEFRATRRHQRLSVKQTFVRHVLLQLVPASWMRLWINHRNGLALFGPTLPLSQEMIRSRDRNARPWHRWRSGDSQRVGMLGPRCPAWPRIHPALPRQARGRVRPRHSRGALRQARQDALSGARSAQGPVPARVSRSAARQ
jgi:hypothetical protein